MGSPVINSAPFEKSSQFNKVTNSTKDLFVTLWGVRGTIPSPDLDKLKYGGDTSCVEIQSFHKGKTISLIFDAGTGIIKYGENSLLKGQKVFHLFFSHMHYDHIIGLTRFLPLFRDDCEIHIYGQAKQGFSLQKIIENFFRSPFFPVEFDKLPCLKNLYFHEINLFKSLKVGSAQIDSLNLNHPQESIAYRIWDWEKKTSVVYATDHEHGTKKDKELEKFIFNTDLFIFDSTYSEDIYKNHKGWGHSTAKFGAEISARAKVLAYYIFHHDPSSTDDYLENQILPEAQKYFKNSYLSKQHQSLSVQEIRSLLLTQK